MHRIATIQMTSDSHVSKNLQKAAELIHTAAEMGAKLAVLPENFAQMGQHQADMLQIQEPMGQGEIQDFLSQQAKLNNIWIVGGTVAISSDHANKVYSACLLFDNTGQCVVRYDKMHLFDVLVGSQERYQESSTIAAGQQVVVVNTPFGNLGLAICYDLRFPELFRSMLAKNVELIAIPAAFTATTGKAHWEVLLRARAIENLCYVIAANQSGTHANERQTYGDSMIVDPWGSVITRLKQGVGVVCADIDTQNLTTLHQKFPAREHQCIRNL
ncbi:carbon-nitrogen hydrolase family protein [Candidatus Albibeggiatoa sp. nov. NOAA]|uniref:carbon-nitrogen hydrolase family protein n=1 Tax=Candidatus Albibeggiatoa sp. nov. NOAA TaxID=3162724 RepID=UPI0032FFEC96|nr:carbon-nitrogen hydrolase family protein [Thiotrichaceae bacterium]